MGKCVKYLCDVCGTEIRPAVDGGGFIVKKDKEVERVYVGTDKSCEVALCAKCSTTIVRQISKALEDY